MAGERLVDIGPLANIPPTGETQRPPISSGLPTDWSKFRNRLAQTALTLPDELKTRTLQGVHRLHQVLNEIPWLVSEDAVWLNLKIKDGLHGVGEGIGNMGRFAEEAVVFARRHPRLVVAEVGVGLGAVACAAGVGEQKDPNTSQSPDIRAIAAGVSKQIIEHDPRIPAPLKTVYARAVDDFMSGHPSEAKTPPATRVVIAEPTSVSVQEVYLSTDAQGHIVKPTEDLTRRLPQLKSDILTKQLPSSMLRHPELFTAPPNTYGVVEHDVLSSDANNLDHIAYLITDKPKQISTEISGGTVKIKISSDSNLFYWTSNNQDKPIRVNLPQGAIRDTIIFDAGRNQLMVEVADSSGKRVGRVIPLTGSGAGEMVPLATVSPTATVAPTETPKPIPTLTEREKATKVADNMDIRVGEPMKSMVKEAIVNIAQYAPEITPDSFDQEFKNYWANRWLTKYPSATIEAIIRDLPKDSLTPFSTPSKYVLWVDPKLKCNFRICWFVQLPTTRERGRVEIDQSNSVYQHPNAKIILEAGLYKESQAIMVASLLTRLGIPDGNDKWLMMENITHYMEYRYHQQNQNRYSVPGMPYDPKSGSMQDCCIN